MGIKLIGMGVRVMDRVRVRDEAGVRAEIEVKVRALVWFSSRENAVSWD